MERVIIKGLLYHHFSAFLPAFILQIPYNRLTLYLSLATCNHYKKNAKSEVSFSFAFQISSPTAYHTDAVFFPNPATVAQIRFTVSYSVTYPQNSYTVTQCRTFPQIEAAHFHLVLAQLQLLIQQKI